ncbi:glycoprotein precursor [Wuchang Cockroach Virus 1]|uniref:Glycoprotein n=1 Tax=Wuchang Cockroach Virus 1 TaxID=1608097 RepID=A0A0B5KS28_9VIRU|nr:glycoprotein precursor [Wuchang Cockroach Virus 1]AJG39291.1 glycoprotein precursor [Wuchang Cockroach Virus 1]
MATNLLIFTLTLALTFPYVTNENITFPVITINYGEINIQPGEKCTIESNGITYNWNGVVQIPGLWFGKVDIHCGIVTQTIVSIYKCKPCGFYCNYNELSTECSNGMVPMGIGLAIAIVLFILAVCIFGNFMGKLVTSIIKAKHYLIQRYSDYKSYKIAKTITSRTNANVTVKFTNVKGLKDSQQVKILKLREKKVSKLRGLPHHYTEIHELDNKYESSKAMYLATKANKVKYEQAKIEYEQAKIAKARLGELSKKAPNPPARRSLPVEDTTIPSPSVSQPAITYHQVHPPKKIYPSLYTVGLVLMLFSYVSSCDQTLFLKADGKLCDDIGCHSMNMYSLPLSLGQTICFKDINGEMFEIWLDETHLINSYSAIYYTGSFILESESHWNCERRGYCYSDYCTDGFHYPNFGNKFLINGYTCLQTTLDCDTYCDSTTMCVYIHWWIREKNFLYKVYKLESSIWEAVLKTKYKGHTTTTKLNVNRPSTSLTDFTPNNNKGIPMFLTNFESERKHVETHLISIDGVYWETTASELNMPETDKVGDFQVSLDKKTQTYNSHMVKCDTKICMAKCTAPEPKFDRFRMTLKNRPNKRTLFRVTNHGDSVMLKTPIVGTGTLMVGNVDLINLHVQLANCKFNLLTTYSCTGCVQRPYAIFQSYDNKNNGIVPFVSNCTFNIDYLSCNPQPFTIELISDERACLIYAKSINYTKVINFNYTFIGSLDLTKTIDSIESTSEQIKSIATDMRFWSSLLTSFTTFTIIGIAATVIVRIVRGVLAWKTIKENPI